MTGVAFPLLTVRPIQASAHRLDEHARAIEGLAREFKRPVPAIAEIYWSELSKLRQGAKTDIYLSLITARKVREKLHRLPRE